MAMTLVRYEEYLRAFSEAADKSALFDDYYSPGVVFVHPIKGTFRGKDELVTFWNSGDGAGHDGVSERLHLRSFVSSENEVAAQLAIEWFCFKDTEYLGARASGETFWGRCAAFYECEGEKFSKVELDLELVEPSWGEQFAPAHEAPR